MVTLPWEPDRRKPVYARSGWQIPLPELREFIQLREYQTEPHVRRRTNVLLGAMEKKDKKVLGVRSVSPHMYNCVGMIFSSRRAWIHIDEIYDILTHDGYNEIRFNRIEVGDVVVYTEKRNPEHVGLITHVGRRKGEIENVRVLSKWGKEGEIEHYLNVVPERFGQPSEFWSERVSYVAR